MSDARRPRLPALCLPLLLAAGAVAAAAPERGTLVIVAPDVEIVAERAGRVPALPSAAASEVVARQWTEAVAAALARPGPPPVWTPPAEMDDRGRLGQVLALEEAIADTVALAGPRADRPPTLGGGARELAAATGATHALFARIRGGIDARQDVATALLFDLRDGALVAAHVEHDVDAGDGGRVARRLARGVLGRDAAGWRIAPSTSPPGPPVLDDLERAIARHERDLRRHPLRVRAPALEAYLRDVACRVDPAGCTSVRLFVLREPGAQATALHGGALVLRTGLLLRLRDEAELAFVLAHELAHARRGDGRRRWDAAVDASRADAMSTDDAAARARETAADVDAFAMLAAAGYDLAAPTRLWRRLLEEQRAGAAPPPRASHPQLAERLAAAPTTTAPGGTTNADTWRGQLAPFLPAWLAEETRRGRPASTFALPAATARDVDEAEDGPPAAPPGAPDAVDAPPARDSVRVLGLKLPDVLPWTRRPGIGIELWTVDGLPLNRLVIVSRLPPGEPLFRAATAGAPSWHAGGGADTVPDLVVAALEAQGWRDVRAAGRRAHAFGGVAGGRAEIALADARGLRHRGTLAFAERDGRLTLLLWFAPEEHYYPRDAAAVAAMLDGLRFAE